MKKPISVKKPSVKKLFDVREKTFKKNTDAIFETISHALQGIEKFLKIGEHNVMGNEMKWEDVSFVPELEKEHEGYIMLVGIIAYRPGELFTLPTGEVVTITEQTAEYFQRIIRVGLPYKLAVEGSVEDVVKFMEEAAKLDPYDPELILEPNDAPALVPVSDPLTEFDLDELTDEQRESLLLHLKSAGYKN